MSTLSVDQVSTQIANVAGGITVGAGANVETLSVAGTANVGGDMTITGNLYGSYMVAGTMNVQTFTANGTWTKPAGLKSIKVTVIGAGGQSSDNNPPTELQGAGGGGGGAAIRYIPAPSIPGPVTIVVCQGQVQDSPIMPTVRTSFGGVGAAWADADPGAHASPGPGFYGGGAGSNGQINLKGWPNNTIEDQMGGHAAIAFGYYGKGGDYYSPGSSSSNSGIVIVEEYF